MQIGQWMGALMRMREKNKGDWLLLIVFGIDSDSTRTRPDNFMHMVRYLDAMTISKCGMPRFLPIV